MVKAEGELIATIRLAKPKIGEGLRGLKRKDSIQGRLEDERLGEEEEVDEVELVATGAEKEGDNGLK